MLVRKSEERIENVTIDRQEEEEEELPLEAEQVLSRTSSTPLCSMKYWN